jgi:hypothetical protein
VRFRSLLEGLRCRGVFTGVARRTRPREGGDRLSTDVGEEQLTAGYNESSDWYSRFQYVHLKQIYNFDIYNLPFYPIRLSSIDSSRKWERLVSPAASTVLVQSSRVKNNAIGAVDELVSQVSAVVES